MDIDIPSGNCQNNVHRQSLPPIGVHDVPRSFEIGTMFEERHMANKPFQHETCYASAPSRIIPVLACQKTVTSQPKLSVPCRFV